MVLNSLNKEIIEKIKDYAINYLRSTTYTLQKDEGWRIGLPNPYISPNDEIFKLDFFYWDTYFINLGLLAIGEVDLAKGMVDNLVYLYERFEIIPMRNRIYNLGTSQPPFLTSMILDIFQKTQDVEWLKRTIATAEKELNNYWMGRNYPVIHMVYKGLSRYCDHYITHATAEHESGWDMTSRFEGKALNFLPIDLNVLLYKYERDISYAFQILGEEEKSLIYRERAEKRKETIIELMWDEKEGFFFDYNYVKKEKKCFYSVAGFYPLWAGMVERNMAKQIVESGLEKLEYAFGVANTQPVEKSSEYRQHDYPNGWPHQQYIVVRGLLNYGFKKEAERIMKRWLLLNIEIFEKTERLWEKYNVVKGDIGKSGRYPTQHGFGWTNGVFLKFADLLGLIS